MKRIRKVHVQKEMSKKDDTLHYTLDNIENCDAYFISGGNIFVLEIKKEGVWAGPCANSLTSMGTPSYTKSPVSVCYIIPKEHTLSKLYWIFLGRQERLLKEKKLRQGHITEVKLMLDVVEAALRREYYFNKIENKIKE